MPPEAGVLDSVSSVSAMAVSCLLWFVRSDRAERSWRKGENLLKIVENYGITKDVSRDFGGVRSNKAQHLSTLAF